MHYFKLNIPDWTLSTAHLSLEEEAAYFRLIRHYYDTEQPIPLETQSVFRRLRMGCHSVVCKAILDEFFVQTEKGYTHKKCDEIIKEYKKSANKNKKNGALGGRPRKHSGSGETQSKPSGFNDETQSKPKHNPNHKPITNNHKPVTNKNNTSDDVVKVFEYWQMIMGKSKSKLTAKRKRLIESRLKDYSFDDLIRAVDGCQASDYHMGQNDRNVVYNEIELIFRSAEKVEQFQKYLTPVKQNGKPQGLFNEQFTDAELIAQLDPELARQFADQSNGHMPGVEAGGFGGALGLAEGVPKTNVQLNDRKQGQFPGADQQGPQ